MDSTTPLITDADLRKICIELEDYEDVSTDIFISSAHTIVYEELLNAGYGTERLTLIELYLAAHFAALTYPVTASEGIGGKVNESFQYKVGLGLNFTKYGQQALLLSGGLLATKRVSINWLGSLPA
jgi:hypothetical protein